MKRLRAEEGSRVPLGQSWDSNPDPPDPLEILFLFPRANLGPGSLGRLLLEKTGCPVGNRGTQPGVGWGREIARGAGWGRRPERGEGKVSRAEGAVSSSGRPKGGSRAQRLHGRSRLLTASREKAAALPGHESVTLGWDQRPRLGSP